MLSRIASVTLIAVLSLTALMALLASAGVPPHVLEGAPDNVTFEEDGFFADLNLYDVFADEDPQDESLNLSVFPVDHLVVTLNASTGEVNITAEEDWNGEEVVVFRAMDMWGYIADHSVTVTVLPVNDAPEALGKIPRVSWYEGQDHQFNASQYFVDVDGDALYYYGEVELAPFNITNGDPTDPVFDLVPTDRMFYGYLRVTITVFDKDPDILPGEGSSASQTAIFEVLSVNSRPTVVRYSPGEASITIHEMEAVNLTILSVTDVDSTIFWCTWYVNGVADWTYKELHYRYPPDPSYMTAGTYNITAVVMDSSGARADNCPSWTLVIANVNRLPTIELVVDRITVPHGENFTLNATASDPDGEVLNFKWYRLRDDDSTRYVGAWETFVYERELAPGRYRFVCQVSDGIDTVTSEPVTVIVEEGPPGVDMRAMALLLVGLGAAWCIMVWLRFFYKKTY